MSKKSNARNTNASSGEVVVRLFEDGDNERIMDIVFWLTGTKIYCWSDRGLVTKTEDYDEEEYGTEDKRAMVEQIGRRSPPGNVHCGAFAGDRMVGFLSMFLFPDETDMWGISHCFVSKGFKRQGIATRMFAMAKEAAIEEGAKKLCFMSATNESAVAFYLSVGFTPHRRPPEEERWLSRWDGADIYMEMKL